MPRLWPLQRPSGRAAAQPPRSPKQWRRPSRAKAAALCSPHWPVRSFPIGFHRLQGLRDLYSRTSLPQEIQSVVGPFQGAAALDDRLWGPQRMHSCKETLLRLLLYLSSTGAQALAQAQGGSSAANAFASAVSSNSAIQGCLGGGGGSSSSGSAQAQSNSGSGNSGGGGSGSSAQASAQVSVSLSLTMHAAHAAWVS